MERPVRHFQFDGEAQLVIEAVRDNFPVLREWIAGIADELQFQAREKKQILIACDEIFTNISIYAYGENTGKVTVQADYFPAEQELHIVFSDNGIAFDPLKSEAPDIQSSLAERKVGGLGLFMVKKMMDAVTYTRQNDCNILTLIKKLKTENQ
ncbi:MAG: ATP-binding protein [Lentisphaeria bacterium]|mgnify:CR=1 FL=1|nr:ATP-binding protein [Lentisphaeria bacterium]MBR2626345.1 ATP-binding protein [Lentisphaeria bacterium]